MAFRFRIDHIAYFPKHDMLVFDGQLLSGEIHFPVTAAVKTESERFIVKVTSIGLGGTVEDLIQKRFALVIEKTDFLPDQLVGHVLEEL